GFDVSNAQSFGALALRVDVADSERKVLETATFDTDGDCIAGSALGDCATATQQGGPNVCVCRAAAIEVAGVFPVAGSTPLALQVSAARISIDGQLLAGGGGGGGALVTGVDADSAGGAGGGSGGAILLEGFRVDVGGAVAAAGGGGGGASGTAASGMDGAPGR